MLSPNANAAISSAADSGAGAQGLTAYTWYDAWMNHQVLQACQLFHLAFAGAQKKL